MKKQAILIMYHKDYYVLENLLKQIDLKYFDIYIHIDKKVSNKDFNLIKKEFNNDNIYYIKRHNVKWSTYSQIECELNLFKESNKKKYQYYHLMSGNDLLIKNSKEIYDFFAMHKEEFVGYIPSDEISNEIYDRIRYYHFLNGNRRHNNSFIRYLSNKIYYNSLRIQKKLGINRIKKLKIEIKKGANWVSITNSLVEYILNNRKEIKKIFKYSNCADELFIQTILYNSPYKNNIYNEFNDEHKNIYRLIDWNRGEPYIFKESDFKEIVNSQCFFARKFSSEIDANIINKIYNKWSRR